MLLRFDIVKGSFIEIFSNKKRAVRPAKVGSDDCIRINSLPLCAEVFVWIQMGRRREGRATASVEFLKDTVSQGTYA